MSTTIMRMMNVAEKVGEYVHSSGELHINGKHVANLIEVTMPKYSSTRAVTVNVYRYDNNWKQVIRNYFIEMGADNVTFSCPREP